MENTKTKNVNIRAMTVSALMAAIAFGLQFVEISIPLMPSFIKLDLSDFPALLTSFAFGPIYGVAVELVKNIIHLPLSGTGGVGELANFLLGAIFVIPAGLIYHHNKTKKTAVIGSLTGAVAMAVCSIATNYFIAYPFYYNFMPQEAIVSAYQAIYSGVNSIIECLIVFNVPFTLCKGLVSVIIVLPTYKYLSPLLKGKN